MENTIIIPILITLLLMSPIWGYAIYLQIKVRLLNIYERNSHECPDQITRYYKINLYSRKRKKCTYIVYRIGERNNIKNKLAYDTIMEENAFQMFR